MKLKLFGAFIGAAMLALAAPAGAATVTGTSIVNDLGTVSGSTNFQPASLANGVNGINGNDNTSGQQYFDYIFKFTLGGASNVSITTNPTVGTNLKDYHSALFNTSPAGTALVPGSNGLTIALNSFTGLQSLSGTTLTKFLSAGTYYLRLFGVAAGNSAKNSVLTSLTGNINATVAATPIPPALLLFGTALGGLGFMARRRKASTGSAAA